MSIAITRLLIENFDLHYGLMLPALIIEVCIWVTCFFGYALSIVCEEEKRCIKD